MDRSSAPATKGPMPENPRQEIELSLGGQTYRVRPTFEVIAGIEADLNQPARAVGMKAWWAGLTPAQRAARDNVGGPEISLTEMAVVVFWMVKGQTGAPASPVAMGALLMEDGYGELLLPVGQFLTRAQRGNKIHEKEAAQAAEAAAREGASEGAANPPQS